MKNIDDLALDVKALRRLNATFIVIRQMSPTKVLLVNVEGRVIRIGREVPEPELKSLNETLRAPHIEETYERGIVMYAFPPADKTLAQFAREYGRLRSQG